MPTHKKYTLASRTNQRTIQNLQESIFSPTLLRCKLETDVLRTDKRASANRVARPAGTFQQGGTLTPPYVRFSHTAVHGVKDIPINDCSGRCSL